MRPFAILVYALLALLLAPPGFAAPTISSEDDGSGGFFTVRMTFGVGDPTGLVDFGTRTPLACASGTAYLLSGDGSVTLQGSATKSGAVDAASTALAILTPAAREVPFGTGSKYLRFNIVAAGTGISVAAVRCSNSQARQTVSADSGSQASLYLNVRDFGATGNGATDDRPAFTSTYTAAGAAGVGVFVPCGAYRFASTLALDSSAADPPALVGEGGCSRLLVGAVDMTLVELCNTSTGACTGAPTVMGRSTIRNIVFEDDDPTGAGHSSAAGSGSVLLRIAQFEGLTIENVIFRDAGLQSLICVSGCDDLSIANDIFDGVALASNALTYAITLGQGDTVGLYENIFDRGRNNGLIGTGGAGIILNGTSTVQIFNNRFKSMDGPALTSETGTKIMFQENFVNAVPGALAAVRIFDGMIRDNFVSGSGADSAGCMIDFGNANAVMGNIVLSSSLCAIKAPTINDNWIILNTAGAMSSTTGVLQIVDSEFSPSANYGASRNYIDGIQNKTGAAAFRIAISSDVPSVTISGNRISEGWIKLVSAGVADEMVVVINNSFDGDPGVACIGFEGGGGVVFESILLANNQMRKCQTGTHPAITNPEFATLGAVTCSANILAGLSTWDCAATRTGIAFGITSGQ